MIVSGSETFSLLARSALLFVTGLFLSFAPAFAAPTEPALKFSEVHYFTGPSDLYIAKDGLRLDNKGQLHFSVVAKAPDWQVTVFRTDDKILFTQSLKQFETTGLISDFLVGQKERYPAERWTYRKSTFKLSGFDVVRMTNPFATYKYMTLQQAHNTASQVERILYAIHKMPTCGGIPIAFVGTHSTKEFMAGVDQTGSRQEYFDTKKIEAVSVSPSIFNVPAGYRKASSVRDVVSGKENRDKSEEFFHALDDEKEHLQNLK